MDRVSRSTTGEILTTGRSYVSDQTEVTVTQELASGLKQRVYMKHVGDRGLSTRPISGRDQFSYSRQGLGEWFLDQHMDSALQDPGRQLHMKMCGSADDRGIKSG